MIASCLTAEDTDAEPTGCERGVGRITYKSTSKSSGGMCRKVRDKFDVKAGGCMGRRRGIEIDWMGW